MTSGYPLSGITNPGPHDILCGRGGGTNAHPGNVKFRKLVAVHKLRYLAASKSDKPGVARDVVREWRSLDPPGRFLAKEEDPLNASSAGEEKTTHWYDVGDKKAREKASQCLRERNGAANEAVAALVKSVTANGEACPEDYETLAERVALLQAKQRVANGNMQGMINMNQGDSHGLTEEMIVAAMNAGYNPNMGSYSGINNPNGNLSSRLNHHGGDMSQDACDFDPIPLQQQEEMYKRYLNDHGPMPDSMNGRSRAGLYPQNDEADIGMDLAAQYRQLKQQTQPKRSSMPEFSGGGQQPYIGEATMSREHRLRLLRQRNAMESMTRNNLNGGMDMPSPIMKGNGDEFMNSQNADWIRSMANKRSSLPDVTSNDMARRQGPPIVSINMPLSQGERHFHGSLRDQDNFDHSARLKYDDGNIDMAARLYKPTMAGNMGGRLGNNGIGNNGGFDSQEQLRQSHNSDAARDYMNRLRMLRQEGVEDSAARPDYATSLNHEQRNMMSSMKGGGNGGLKGVMKVGGGSGNDGLRGVMKVGGEGQGRGRSEEFTLEEYQASLQEFLSSNDEYCVPRQQTMRESSAFTQSTQRAGNTNNLYNTTIEYVAIRGGDDDDGGRRSFKSTDTSDMLIGKNTFKPVESSETRKSFRSVDDIDIRSTFRSVDTLDLMSIGNSLKDIVDDDLRDNPGMQQKLLRRNSTGSRSRGGGPSLTDFACFPGQTLEVKTFNHGQGGGSGPKKIKKQSDGRVMGKERSQERGSFRSLMSGELSDLENSTRMSFGNMSMMSELTDFEGLFPSLAAGSGIDDIFD